MATPDIPELSASTEQMPPIKSALEVAHDELQALCDRVQSLRRQIYQADTEIGKAVFKGQIIEVVRLINNKRLDYIASGINVAVTYSEGGCPIRVSRCRKTEFFE